ncbi:MAG: hypothetical protein ACI9F9_002000 [Candidatus Paceibacteria bacterium]
MQSAAEHRLVPLECVLCGPLAVVPGSLLLFPAAKLLDLANRPVTFGRAWPSPSYRCRDGWGDDHAGSSRSRRLVEANRVIRRIYSDRRKLPLGLLDDHDSCCRVIDITLGQDLSLDSALCINTDVEFSPTALSRPSMLCSGPFAFSDDGEFCIDRGSSESASWTVALRCLPSSPRSVVRVSCGPALQARCPSTPVASEGSLLPDEGVIGTRGARSTPFRWRGLSVCAVLHAARRPPGRS